ncbi:hypothetical protein BC941DRAFT_419961 [Chlamydoabsidia padenii]|nr:hypothetical protein BC941DRAFT_419961 [Chlamydoabsidia padenii]
MTSSYTLPSLYEIVKPDYYSSLTIGTSAFHRVGTPPDLLHDSEEDDGDSLPSLHHHHDDDPCHRRKSMPHRSPSVIQDAFQASALDKSVVFQWNTETPTVDHVHSQVICGESLLSALRHRVALARQHDLPIKKRPIQIRRRQLTATCIAMPTHNKHDQEQQHICKHKMSIPVLTTMSPPVLPDPVLSPPPQQQVSPVLTSSYVPPRISLPLSPPTTLHPLTPPPPTSSPSASTPTTPPKQRGRKPSQPTTTTRHTSSGRPSRVKGPCQACHETSDGCMRKAFDWPFPASQIYNDKGKPFVYLCNKCGLRYNKSGGCVCRHCRWVFCKEEKRKAMQYIDKMRRNRPDGHVDMDEDIEHFVCSPKYWSCGRPWKVGWVLNSMDEDDSVVESSPISSPSL